MQRLQHRLWIGLGDMSRTRAVPMRAEKRVWLRPGFSRTRHTEGNREKEIVSFSSRLDTSRVHGALRSGIAERESEMRGNSSAEANPNKGRQARGPSSFMTCRSGGRGTLPGLRATRPRPDSPRGADHQALVLPGIHRDHARVVTGW